MVQQNVVLGCVRMLLRRVGTDEERRESGNIYKQTRERERVRACQMKAGAKIYVMRMKDLR